jgi:acyl carrier protein
VLAGLTLINVIMNTILERLQPIFREVLDNPGLSVAAEDSGHTVDGWDSLAHVSLIAAVEQEFGVRFALGELEELRNIGDMIRLIEQKGGAA